MPRKKYTVALKLAICAYAREKSIHKASKEYSVDHKRIRDWLAARDELSSQPQSAFRLPGGGRKLSLDELEAALVAQILSERANKNRVTRTMIVQWAVELSQEQELGLTFSHGWLHGFLLRHGFVTRAATNKPFLSDAEVVKRATDFVLHVKALVDTYQISVENIFCLDETALFFDHNKHGTIDIRGARHIPVTKFFTNFKI
jgi:transposase